MDPKIFKESFTEITINDYKYRVIDSAFKKYFTLSEVTKFEDVHKYEIVIGDVVAPEIVSDNLIAEVHSGFTCNYIKGDEANYAYYIKFINMYITHELITFTLPRMVMIKETYNFMKLWISGEKISPPLEIYNILGSSMVYAFRSLGEPYKTTKYHCEKDMSRNLMISTVEGNAILLIGFSNPTEQLTRMVLRTLEIAQINIYKFINDQVKLTEDESYVLGLDTEEYNVPTKFI